jgi:hypothetical protein
MAKPEKIVESLNKLYGQRAALDQKVLETEKALLSAVSVVPAPGGAAVKKSAPRKRAPTAKKPPANK